MWFVMKMLNIQRKEQIEDNWKCYRSIEIERLIIKTVRKSNIKLVACVRRQENWESDGKWVTPIELQ